MLEVECGDMRQVLRSLPENSFDSCVCDPPYEISFMGSKWDGTGIAFDPKAWAEVYRVMKPGAHLVAFGGTRTWHRIAVAIEDAGFQLKESMAWLFGSGMPKSQNVERAVARETCKLPGRHFVGKTPKGKKAQSGDHTCPQTPESLPYAGHGSALKPSFEPVIFARKPLIGTMGKNVVRHGTGGLNIDAARVPHASAADFEAHAAGVKAIKERGGSMEGSWKNSSDLSGASDVTDAGRWPPNVIVDEDVAADLDETNGVHPSTPYKGGPKQKRGQIFDLEEVAQGGYSDSGGVSRYFYCPKTNGAERDAGLDHWPVLTGGEATGGRAEDSAGVNNPRAGAGRGGGRRNPHPTIKPLALMRWLCRLVTPPGGFILDPFAGSGTTGCAAALEGFHFAGVELDPVHARLAADRIAYWASTIHVDKV
jgi:site-specific DNA-methyltransferase (adenine-specific)